MTRKAVFLDRDGTLIVDKVYLNDPSKIEYLPGVFEALRLLRDASYRFIVVTNQSGMARGLVDIRNLDKIHELMREEFARNGLFFDGFYYSPYSVESNHPTRKPNPGMLELAAREHRIDLSQSWMIGDRMSDAEAGRRAGARSILLEGADDPGQSPFPPPDAVAADLLAAARFILSSSLVDPAQGR